MALTKTDSINVYTIAQLAANSMTATSEVDVSTYIELFLVMNLGRDDTGGALTAGVIIRVQGNPMSGSGLDQWRDLAVFQSGITVPESEAVSGTCNSGQDTINVASTTNLTTENLILIKNSTIGNSEFRRIRSVTTNTNIKTDDNLTNAQTGSTVYNQAEEFVAQLDVMPYKRLRIQIDNAQNARTVVFEAKASAGTF
jgi:hypothetical protein